MSRTKLEIPSRSGHSIHGVLELPVDRAPRAYGIFCHCFTCTKQIKAAVLISRALARQGIGVLRFDFSGLGESGGDFADTTFTSNLHDVADVANYIAEHYQAPELVIGHSLGGAAALFGAAGIDSVRAIATIGAPADPAHVLHLLAKKRPEIEDHGEAEVMLGGRPFRIKKSFIEDLSNSCSLDTLKTLHKALLILHAPLDKTVGVENARQIFEAAKHPKSFVSLDDADHLLTREGDAEYAATLIAAWASRFVSEQAPLPAESSNLVQAETGGDTYRTELHVRQHSLVADEPPEDTGPTPYDLLGMALGACTTMTLQMYARRKKWPLERVQASILHEKTHAKDCEDCETDKGMVDRFTRELKLEGDLSAEQRARLLEIAERCPVHRTLHSEVKVDSKLADS